MEQDPKKRDLRDEELDRFWDIDALLPIRRQPPRSRKTDTTEITSNPKECPKVCTTPAEPISTSDGEGRKKPTDAGVTVVHTVAAAQETRVHGYVSPTAEDEAKNAPTPEYEYNPESALIRQVRVFRWKSKYQYYEEFLQTAELLREMKGKPCPRVPFFSYVPQYSQMNQAQLSWYLCLRDCIGNGAYPETDYSYLLLYVFEIINLADRMDVRIGQKILVDIWVHYRERYSQLDGYLPEWICDYSLIHRLSPPKNLSIELLTRIMQRCTLKEFYVDGCPEDGYVQALLAFCCNYDYRKSKFCTPEHRDLFDQTIKTVLRMVIDHMSREGKLFSKSNMEDSRLQRDAFSGALCSYRIKRRLEIRFCSFSRSHELRFLIGDVVKYTENKLRAYLGVRSRLSIYALPNAVRNLIDACTAHLCPSRKSEAKRSEEAEIAAYERLYDLPKKDFSLSDAEAIEQSSWDTTKRLVEAFETDAEDDTKPAVTTMPSEPTLPSLQTTPQPIEKNTDDSTDLTARLMPYAAFLQAAMAEDAKKQEVAASELGKLLDAVAEEINELATDAIGDILLEEAEKGYCVIAEYKELLNGFL